MPFIYLVDTGAKQDLVRKAFILCQRHHQTKTHGNHFSDGANRRTNLERFILFFALIVGFVVRIWFEIVRKLGLRCFCKISHYLPRTRSSPLPEETRIMTLATASKNVFDWQSVHPLTVVSTRIQATKITDMRTEFLNVSIIRILLQVAVTLSLKAP